MKKLLLLSIALSVLVLWALGCKSSGGGGKAGGGNNDTRSHQIMTTPDPTYLR